MWLCRLPDNVEILQRLHARGPCMTGKSQHGQSARIGLWKTHPSGFQQRRPCHLGRAQVRRCLDVVCARPAPPGSGRSDRRSSRCRPESGNSVKRPGASSASARTPPDKPVSAAISSITVSLTNWMYYYAPAPRDGGIELWCASDICLSVAYIGPKSKTERPRKTKIGTEVAIVTRDSDTTFKVKRSKVNLQGRGHIVAASCTACFARGSMTAVLQILSTVAYQ